MNEAEKNQHIDDINRMTVKEMAFLLRFAPSGHPYFDNRLPLHQIFSKRFEELGGMTPAISKEIGWGSKTSR